MPNGKKLALAGFTCFAAFIFFVGSLFFLCKNRSVNAENTQKVLNESENRIKVSIIIPVYKAEKYLDKCINSALNQSLKDIEIICIDDGSPDGSAKILDKYAKKDRRVKVIHQENKGAAAARNVGIDAAKGEYIRFCDDDDTMDLKACEICYSKAKAEQADVLYDNMPFNKVLNGPVYDQLKVYVWSGIYRTEFLNKNNIRFYEPIKQYGEDQVFNLMCNPKAKRIVCIKDKLYHHDRASTGNDPKEIKEFPERHRMAVQKIYESWKKDGYFKHKEAKIAFLRWARNMWDWIIRGINKAYTNSIGPELLKDDVLNLLDQNTKDSLKNMMRHSR